MDNYPISASQCLSDAQESYDRARSNVRVTKLEGKIDRIDDRVDSVKHLGSKTQSVIEAFTPAVQDAIASSEGQVFESTIDNFLYGIPAFIEVLEIVGQIHPFVGVVVSAFTIVYNHEKARRSNNEKIAILFVGMKEILRVLLRLQKIRDLGREDTEKLRDLSESAAKIIKVCGNACDTYSKKCLAAKLFHSQTWSKTFTKYIEEFQVWHTEINHALSVISCSTVIQVNQQVTAINHKLDMLLGSLSIEPPKDRRMERILRDCKDDDEKLKEVLKGNRNLYMSGMEANSETTDGELENKKLNEAIAGLKQVVQDTHRDEENNWAKFEQLFELQRRQIEDVQNVVVRQSDRTIDELTKIVNGPVDRIVDKDIHTIWLEGGYRGYAKARHFILAFRDYFHEKGEKEKKMRGQGTSADKWALQYINVAYLQPILEAIDDDANSLIRISEVNVFTTSRPKDWNLPRWIAFWAVGWHASVRKECAKIDVIFGKMFSILSGIRRENQASAETYLSVVWKRVSELMKSLDTEETGSRDVDSMFTSYIEAEENRLTTSLAVILLNAVEGSSTSHDLITDTIEHSSVFYYH